MSKTTGIIAGVLGCMMLAICMTAYLMGPQIVPAIAPSAQHGAAIPADVMTRDWVEQTLVPGSLCFDAPWELKPVGQHLPPGVAERVVSYVDVAYDTNAISVGATVLSVLPGTHLNVDGAADEVLANLKTRPGTLTVETKKSEISVLGSRAIETEARIEQMNGKAIKARGIVFARTNELVTVIFVSPAEEPHAADIWRRMRDSIRRPGS